MRSRSRRLEKAGGVSERVIEFCFARNAREGRGKFVIDARAPHARGRRASSETQGAIEEVGKDGNRAGAPVCSRGAYMHIFEFATNIEYGRSKKKGLPA
jgi:hypothetical protein